MGEESKLAVLLLLAIHVSTNVSTYTTRLVEIRRTSAFLTVITLPYRNTPYNTVQVRSFWKDGVQPYSTVPPYSTMLTVILPFGSNFDPKHSLSFCNILLWIKHRLLTRNQVLRPTLSFHASHCWALPWADVAPTQPQGRSGTHCVASAHKGSMLEVEMGVVWGGEAFLRPFTGSASWAPYRTLYRILP